MNGVRWLVLIAFLGLVHNASRLMAAILGAPWSFFNYLVSFHAKSMTTEIAAQMAGVSAIAIFLTVLCALVWRGARTPNAIWASALVGAILGLLAAGVSTFADKSYGLWLFAFIPVLVGFAAVMVHSLEQPTTLGQAMAVSTLAVAMLGGILILCAIEGLVCLLMALPLAVPLAMAGGSLAYALRRKSAAHNQAIFLLLIGLAPFGSSLELTFPRPAELFTVTTSIDIPASPERVWRTVLQPAKLAPPSQILFRAGIAYPLASHIEGIGPTATRYCDFSTGKLVEPVLIWDEGHRLRFTVVSNPLPMQEWTPYAQIHPPHLEGFLASRQGEFLLEPLPNGGTRLFATTWYQHHMAPAGYWRRWSDYIIHKVHEMVLANIKKRALATPN